MSLAETSLAELPLGDLPSAGLSPAPQHRSADAPVGSALVPVLTLSDEELLGLGGDRGPAGSWAPVVFPYAGSLSADQQQIAQSSGLRSLAAHGLLRPTAVASPAATDGAGQETGPLREVGLGVARGGREPAASGASALTMVDDLDVIMTMRQVAESTLSIRRVVGGGETAFRYHFRCRHMVLVEDVDPGGYHHFSLCPSQMVADELSRFLVPADHADVSERHSHEHVGEGGTDGRADAADVERLIASSQVCADLVCGGPNAHVRAGQPARGDGLALRMLFVGPRGCYRDQVHSGAEPQPADGLALEPIAVRDIGSWLIALLG